MNEKQTNQANSPATLESRAAARDLLNSLRPPDLIVSFPGEDEHKTARIGGRGFERGAGETPEDFIERVRDEIPVSGPPRVGDTRMTHFEKIVTDAGATFLRVENGSVYFADPQDGSVLSLYVGALRDPEDVRFALKSSREKSGEFAQLVPTDSLAF